MSEKNVGLPGFPTLPAMLVAAALFGSAVLVNKPLQSKRAAEKELAGSFRRAEDLAPARLWEDPFEAVARHLSGTGKGLEIASQEFRIRYCRHLLRQGKYGWPRDESAGPHNDQAVAFENCRSDLRRGDLRVKPDEGPSANSFEEDLRALQDIQRVVGIQKRLAASVRKGENILFVGVAVPGGSLEELGEARRRYRIAMVSALNRRGFFPEDEGFASLLFPEDRYQGSLVTHLSRPRDLKFQLVAIPYETFSQQSGVLSELPSRFGRVVVLWLDDSRFGAEIRADLSKIVEVMTQGFSLKLAARQIETALLGPTTSDAALKMLQAEELKPGSPDRPEFKDLDSGAAGRCRVIQDSIKVFSAYATAPEAVARAFSGEKLADLVVSVQDSKLKPTWTSTIIDDAAIIAGLLGELRLRGIDLVRSPVANVALVAELDTSYGRAMPLTFKAAALMDPGVALGRNDLQAGLAAELRHMDLWRRSPGTLPEKVFKRVEKVEKRVHVFRYLRGLDGIAKGKETAGSESKEVEEKPKESLERAEGTSLLDQIRAVGVELQDLDRSLREKRQRIQAIGILGNDFYDKQLALQVLRSSFPDAVFFTTDLDARYLHREDQEWNRNLLVGSSFGFQLNRSLQGDVPPFRDVYATSTFLAGLLALGKCGRTNEAIGPSTPCATIGAALRKVQARQPLPLDPLVYEVGISRVHLLTSPLSPDGLAIQPRFESRPTIPGWQWRLFFLLAVVGFISCLVSHRAWVHWKRIALAIAFVIGGCLVVDLLFDQEPAALLEGVSVQGTELLRLLLIGVAVVLFLVLRYHLRRAQAAIAPRFTSDKAASRKSLAFFETLYINYVFNRAHPKPTDELWDSGDSEVDAVAVWNTYQQLQHGKKGRYDMTRQLLRVLIMTLFPFVVLGLFAFFWPGFFNFPQVPVRGNLAADKVLRYASLFCLTFACFWTFDTVRLCVLFVDRLASARTHWPENEKNSLTAKRRGLGLSYLGDYLDIRVIAPLTEVVSWTVLYPFFLLAIYILSRASFFDYWTWPWIVGAIVIILLGAILTAALLLQRAARKARESTLKFLKLARLSQGAGIEDQNRAKKLEILIEEVEKFDRGAFGPWTSNPVIGALLLPFGGASAATLIEFLLQVGI